jgi:hypothetical protein
MHPQIRIELARLKHEERLTHAERPRAVALPRRDHGGIEPSSERHAVPRVAPVRGVTPATPALIARTLRRLQMALIP